MYVFIYGYSSDPYALFQRYSRCFRLFFIHRIRLYQILSISNFYYIFYMKLVQENLRLLEIQFNLEKQGNSMNKHFNLIRKNYQRVHEMISCLNHTFGWSQFFTILFSFHILLTELNWSYWGLHERSAPYKIGFLIFRNIGNSIFNSFFLVSAFTLWIMHFILIVLYLFLNSTKCKYLV